MPRHTGTTHFQGSKTVQALLSRETKANIGIRGSVGRGSGYPPSVLALCRLLIDFCEGSVRWPVRRAVRLKMADESCVASTGQVASVSIKAEGSCCINDGAGGSRRRGSEMSKASNAPAGNAPGSVTEASDGHSDGGASSGVS